MTFVDLSREDVNALINETIKNRRDRDHFLEKLREINAGVADWAERARLQFELLAQVAHGFGAAPDELEDLARLVAMAPALPALVHDLTMHGRRGEAADEKGQRRETIGALYAFIRFLTNAGRVLPDFGPEALLPTEWLMDALAGKAMGGRFRHVFESVAVSMLVFHGGMPEKRAASMISRSLKARGVQRAPAALIRYYEDIDRSAHKKAAGEPTTSDQAQAVADLGRLAFTPPLESGRHYKRVDSKKQSAYDRFWPIAEKMFCYKIAASPKVAGIQLAPRDKEVAAKAVAEELLDHIKIKPRRSVWMAKSNGE